MFFIQSVVVTVYMDAWSWQNRFLWFYATDCDSHELGVEKKRRLFRENENWIKPRIEMNLRTKITLPLSLGTDAAAKR